MSQQFRFEGLSLTVKDVAASVAFYCDALGLERAYTSLPAFAMVRCGAGTIGLLAEAEAVKSDVAPATPAQARGVHIEFTTDDLDALYTELLAKGVVFSEPPHQEPWEYAMTVLDPDGHSVEFAEGKRGDSLKKT
jgi:catechol 2,3-dioxygenase-like lactoylglutathione lyase family enzyme